MTRSIIAVILLLFLQHAVRAQRQMEKLGRGVVRWTDVQGRNARDR